MDVAEVRETGRQEMHMGVVYARHDEAPVQVMHNHAMLARGGHDGVGRAHEGKDALGRHDEGLGPCLVLVNREDAAVDVGGGVFEAGRGWMRSHWVGRGFHVLHVTLLVSCQLLVVCSESRQQYINC